MRLKLTLEYDGTDFRGWAAQPGRRTVEGALRDGARCDLTRRSTALAVAGRTDAGVHALANVAPSTSTAGRRPSGRRRR